MKLENTKQPFPLSESDWERLISEAPGNDIKLTVDDKESLKQDTVVMRKGDSSSLLLEMKLQRQRGKQKLPTKQPISIRLSSEVINYFKSVGKGWQTNIDKVLVDYVKDHQKT